MQSCSPVKDTDRESNWATFFLPSTGVMDSEVPALGTSVAGKWGVDGHGRVWTGMWMGSGWVWEQGLAPNTPVGGAPHGQALGRWPLAAIHHHSIVIIGFMKRCRPVMIKAVRSPRLSLFYKHYILPYSYLKNCSFPKPSPSFGILCKPHKKVHGYIW